MILMNDFQSEPVELRAKELAAARDVIESGWYVLGRRLEAFEQEWASTCGTAYAVGVGNGMDAIEIALRALDIGPGDEVVTTPMTAFATVLAIMRAGAIPVLADIEMTMGILDPVSVERCLNKRTRAVVLVHLYGQMASMDCWTALCEEHGLALIEDCAQAHLARWRGHVAGSVGRIGTYSFYPTKNLGALGDGGALVTQDSEVAMRAKVLRNYGQSERYHHPVIGLNSRLDEMQAAILLVRLAWLRKFNTRRRAVAQAYRRGIANQRIELLAAPESEEAHVYHLFVVRCDERDRLQDYLTASGVQSLIHYPVPIHRQRSCAGVAIDPRGLAVAELHAATCLSLPCHPGLTDAQIAQVVEVVNAFR